MRYTATEDCLTEPPDRRKERFFAVAWITLLYPVWDAARERKADSGESEHGQRVSRNRRKPMKHYVLRDGPKENS